MNIKAKFISIFFFKLNVYIYTKSNIYAKSVGSLNVFQMYRYAKFMAIF